MSDIVEKFTTHLKNVLTHSLMLVVESGADTITPEHLLWGVATEQGSIGGEILRKAHVEADDLRAFIGAPKTVLATPATPTADALPRLSESAKRIIEKAVLTATVYEHRHVGTEHLLAGMLQVSHTRLALFFKQHNIKIDDIRTQLSMLMKSTQTFPTLLPPRPSSSTHTQQNTTAVAEAEAHEHDIDEELAHSNLPTLEYFGVELTVPDATALLDPVIGRDEEIQRVIEILTRRTKNNPILVGEPGVGKTAIVEGLARRIIEGTVPASLLHKRLFVIDMGAIVAGTVYRGEFEGRLKQIIDEVRDQPDVILFIDEAHTMMGAGSASGSLDAANLLKPALARGWIRCIGATTPAEYKKHIESDGALERRFQRVHIDEPTPEETVEILRGLAPRYAEFHHVRIPDETLRYAVRASERHIHDNALPDKAIDLIDEAAAHVQVANTREGDTSWRGLIHELRALREQKRAAVVEERFLDASLHKQQEDQLEEAIHASRERGQMRTLGTVTVEDVAAVVERRTGVHVRALLEHEREALADLAERLQGDIFGQDVVLRDIAGAVRRARLGLQSHRRPTATFLFVGPSGTGKSETARQIARHVFGDEKALIRLDMSEYAEGHSISKLVGAPAGYVGYRDTARLTDAVKARPHSVVLFDEIEKAHRDVHHLLLQMLEHGELTDATGRTVSFRHTIIVLTSNVGAERFENGAIGFGDDRTVARGDIVSALKEQFRPELLNRLDHIHVFAPLSAATLKRIARRELQELKERLKQQEVSLKWPATVVSHLVATADAPLSNARTVKARVNTLIADLVANHLLAHPRDTALVLSVNKNALACKTQTR